MLFGIHITSYLITLFIYIIQQEKDMISSTELRDIIERRYLLCIILKQIYNKNKRFRIFAIPSHIYYMFDEFTKSTLQIAPLYSEVATIRGSVSRLREFTRERLRLVIHRNNVLDYLREEPIYDKEAAKQLHSDIEDFNNEITELWKKENNINYLVTCLSASGNELYSGGGSIKSGVIRVFNARTYELTNTMVGHTGMVTCLHGSEPRVIYSGSAYPDRTIKVWDKENYKCLATLRKHSNDIKYLSIHNNKLYSCEVDKIYVWEASEPYNLITIIKSASGVKELGFYNNIMICYRFRSIGLWNTDNKTTKITDFPMYPQEDQNANLINCMAVHGNRVYAGGIDGTISVWNLDYPYAHVSSLESNQGKVKCLAIHDNTFTLYSGGHDGSICVWDMKVEPHSLVEILDRHMDSVTSLVIHKNKLYSGSGSREDSIKVWKIEEAYKDNKDNRKRKRAAA